MQFHFKSKPLKVPRDWKYSLTEKATTRSLLEGFKITGHYLRSIEQLNITWESLFCFLEADRYDDVAFTE